MSVKVKIVESIEAAMSLLKCADSEVFSTQHVTRDGKSVNKIEVIFMEYMSAVLDLDVMYADEFKNKHLVHQVQSANYARLNPETTPSTLVFDAKIGIEDMIVHNPNGSQSWPDILVIKDNVGYPLEIKTATSIPKMNSGIFRLNTPYVAIKKSKNPKKRTMRMFLGSDMVTNKQLVKWRKSINKIKAKVKKIDGPEYRVCYDNFFKSLDWFPKNSYNIHATSVLKYLKD